jgi:GT2 family glycosyltransferase
MDASPDVGVCGPQLLNPDGTLQHSCFRLPSLLLPAFRRTPLGRLAHGRSIVENYLMVHDGHDETMDVDSLIGAALFCRAEVLRRIGMFDEQFFMYYEDNDLCRRFWLSGQRVVYHPKSVMVHYHRRASADGSLFSQLFSKFAWIQIASFVKYYRKYYRQPNPRVTT